MEEVVGKNFGPYKIVAPLGGGGMATVYRGYQPGMDRYVAIKVLPPAYALDSKFVERFRREARTIAKLEHPHILPVHDFGEAQGSLYLVMRLIETGTLHDRMEAGPLPLDEAGKVIAQLADALDYAHSQGVIHRDLKPSNVLIDRRGDCFLADFGIAKLLQESAFTTSGSLLGTPQYVSPEQVFGQPVDHRSDLYALGVMLYQMTAGRLPFEADTAMAMALKHAHEPPLPPRAANPNIPPALETVILRALEKNPDDRFQSGLEFARAVKSALSAMPEPRSTSMPTVIAAPSAPASPQTVAAPPASTSSLAAVPQTVAAPPASTAPLPAGPVTTPVRATRPAPFTLGVIAVIAVAVIIGGGLLTAGLWAGLTWLRSKPVSPSPAGKTSALLEETFSDTALGWELSGKVDRASGRYDTASGEYVIQSANSGQLVAAAAHMPTFKDTLATLETYVAQGTDFKYGLMCRHQADAFSGYAFLVRHPDLVRISRWDDGSENNLAEFSTPAVVAAVGQHIEIAVACVGSDFTLAVNGTQLYEFSDVAYTSGDFALLVESLSDEPAEIRFDKLIVTPR